MTLRNVLKTSPKMTSTLVPPSQYSSHRIVNSKRLKFHTKAKNKHQLIHKHLIKPEGSSKGGSSPESPKSSPGGPDQNNNSITIFSTDERLTETKSASIHFRFSISCIWCFNNANMTCSISLELTSTALRNGLR